VKRSFLSLFVLLPTTQRAERGVGGRGDGGGGESLGQFFSENSITNIDIIFFIG
jgi:hypothetical protein